MSVLGAWILRLLFLTLRLRVGSEALDRMRETRGSVLITFWHNRILGIALAFLREYPLGRVGVTVLTSPSRDGEILAGVVGRLGMGAVRGSSSRRGARALRELVRLVAEGRDIAITPDGPRGPRYVLGPGVVHLAQTTGAPIMPVHARFSRAFRMKTWDGFNVPLPFSRVEVNVSPMIYVPKDMDAAGFEGIRKQVEEVLRDGAD
jgi:lysophospholipid acyltransferase (LPLAT)-like uncharacterized protein